MARARHPLPARGVPRRGAARALARRAVRDGLPTALLAAGLLLGTCVAAVADDLVARRAACTEVARDRITAPARAGSEFYRFVVERRKAFVQKCMEEKGPLRLGERGRSAVAQIR